jgi:hypothetical protein
MLTVLTQGPPFLWVIEAACPVFRAGSCFEAKRFACAIENGNGNIQSSGAPQRPACRLAIAPSMRQSAPRQIPERQSVSLKRRRKIAVVGRLNPEYGTPASNVLRMSSIGIPALRIATLANSARVCSIKTVQPERIARVMSSRARSALSSATEAVA